MGVCLHAQSPHGEEFSIACEDCHNPKGWTLEAGTYTFNHNSTNFILEGVHQEVNCKSCHKSLVFSKAESECISCHTDMHYQTVGTECDRCHTPNSWIVNNITDIHQQSRFPLVGAHYTADCYQCHPSASLLKFEPLGIECYDCHQQDYLSATQPNHVEGNFSTDCYICHSVSAFSWISSGFNHSFFPLTAGHDINNCKECHTGPDFSGLSAECYSCHQDDYASATNPNHLVSDFSINCTECHTTNPGWKPADFREHDALYFPIYSGEHGGEWNSCTECHLNPNNYASFTCIDCHEHNQADMDDEHEGVGGYMYNSPACLDCHPTGSSEGSFNHSATNFPLTGEHVNTDCRECHPEFYIGTSTFCYDCHTDDFNLSVNPNHLAANIQITCEECHTTDAGWKPASFDIHNEYYELTGAHASSEVNCYDCHQGNYNNTPIICAECHLNDYNQAVNPNHITVGIENVCEQCHTTIPGWKPAAFPTHDEYFVLQGAHAAIANDCVACHEGNYNNTPNDCFGCHENDFNQTNDPPHQSAQFPTDCELCHTQVAWEPSTFNHDGLYFPIYSGKHRDEWNSCADCHLNPGNYALFSCIDCHEHNQTDMDEQHQDVNDYIYNSIACLDCHPNGEGDKGHIKKSNR